MNKFPVSTSFDTFVRMTIITHRFWDGMSSDSHCCLSLCALSGSEPGLLTIVCEKVCRSALAVQTQMVLDWIWPCPTVTSGKIEALHPYIAIVTDVLFRKQKMLLFLYFILNVWKEDADQYAKKSRKYFAVNLIFSKEVKILHLKGCLYACL